MKKLVSPHGFFEKEGIAVVRIVTGVFMAYHGFEVFDSTKMNDYRQWLTDLKFPAPVFMAYLGKGTEFVCGVLLAVGLFTRLATIPLMITMCIIAFGMGHGKIFMEDQHPFLFVLLLAVFFFAGPGKWSMDHLFFKYKR
ncbi:DoxX family protein [Foetidibacter luteolus]|uniref:DoxX family protein n=1 Tax=Foetidibacter luteolus TaxID=2608880 RepID=UPI00129C075F|nr:DoxX family protein [Foetidibacter luteolus]